MKKRLLLSAFVLIILVGALHYVGSVFYFYWNSFWFDFLMHFLGGLSMGLLFLWIWYVSGLFGRSLPGPREAMTATLAFVLLVSIGWEIFEYAYNIANPIGGNYPVDTFHDLLADFFGGAIAGLLGQVRRLYE